MSTQKLSAVKVLRESHGKRRQVVGNYVKIEDDKIVGYCALGALACEAGGVELTKGSTSNDGITSYSTLKILQSLKAYDLPFRNTRCPICGTSRGSILDLITHLNDIELLSFFDIAIALEQEGLE